MHFWLRDANQSVVKRLHGFVLALLLCVAAGRVYAAGMDRMMSLPRFRAETRDENWLAPSALAATSDGKLLVACGAAHRVDVFDLAQGKVIRRYPVPGKPSGIVVNQSRVYVTCASPTSLIFEINLATDEIAIRVTTGHTALSPVLSADGKTLLVCLKFNNQIARWDTSTWREAQPINVGREPVSAALSPDGNFLFVAHHLPSGPANGTLSSATLGVVDLQQEKMTRELPLPNGSSQVREIRLSPDGRYAAVAHNLGHFQMPTTQVERGWINTSALTLVDVAAQSILDTVVLDEVDRGAANPWAVAWSSDGRRLFTTHAGTHELSVINFPGLLEKLAAFHKAATDSVPPDEDLSFLVGLRDRIKLAGKGPRALAFAGGQLCIGEYFSDSIELLDCSASVRAQRSLAMAPETPFSVLRQGELNFNDATLSFQGWQSCASCHSEDGRVDGLNWDLLNDGIGSPKNTRSLLLAHRTPPAMSTGARRSAEEAVRAGLQHVLFANPSEQVAAPLDQWLKSLQPIPSPHLVKGELSPAAQRGQAIFNDPKTGCSSCHKPELFTDLTRYDVGTAGPPDQNVRQFYTPTLLEIWRTAPYLHDGSAATIRDVLVTRNKGDQHGQTSHLSDAELNDLSEYLLSL